MADESAVRIAPTAAAKRYISLYGLCTSCYTVRQIYLARSIIPPECTDQMLQRLDLKMYKQFFS